MSIDAIGSVFTGVGALGASRPDLAAGQKGRAAAPPAAANQGPSQPDATVVALSQEAQAQQQAAADQAAQQQAAADQAAQQQAAADQAAQQQAAAASISALTGAVASDWAAGTPPVDNAAVQQALAALDEASRQNNLQIQADAISAQQDQTAREQEAIDAAAQDASRKQDDVVLAAINAGIRLAFGALSTPITGDPALRQPGKVEIVA